MSISGAGTNISEQTMREETKFWKVAKWLPFGSLVNYIKNEQSLKKSFPLSFGKTILHIAYFTASLVTTADYLKNVLYTGTLSPSRQAEIRRQHSDLQNTLFEGINPLADTNRDGKVDLGEKVKAYETMGLGDEISFPRANIEQLEKAVKAYETKEERR